MEKKISPIIILAIILVIVAVGIFIFSMINSDEGKENGENPTKVEEILKPMLDLSINTSEENQERVIISAHASMEDGSAITSIILPDGTKISAAEATYEVIENGEYSFRAVAENGGDTIVSINVSNIKEASAWNPYIPEGFSAVEGTDVENGFVIEDSYGNQYVWVPVENGQLIRDTILDSKYEETNSTASALVNSVAQNYGFYIARYEASEYELNGEKVAATMGGKIPWTNITCQDAIEYANVSSEKFGYEGYQTAMINSYAWDTILKWFDKRVENYSTNVNYGNYSGSIYPTGATESDIVYNICDIAGNVREWTTEIYKGKTGTSKKEEIVINRVVRGGGASLSRTPKSHTGYPENTFEAYWGFRMILYK